MSLPVVLSEAAEGDFDEAVDWCEQRSGLGARFISNVREALQRIGKTPELHAVIHVDIRRTTLRRFPYHVYSRIRPGRVEVIAIQHNPRNPAEWQGRS